MDDMISRQAALDAIDKYILGKSEGDTVEVRALLKLIVNIYRMPSAQPTLYGYKLEHLAYIARVMEKEGITAEDGHCHLAEPYVPDVNDGKKEDE